MDQVNADRLKGGLAKALAVIVIIGAINWGLIGFFNWNFVDAIFGGGARMESSAISRLIYSIVGLAGLALALTFPWRRPLESTTTTTTTTLRGGRSNRREEVRP
jgi:uncharacterized protein